MEFMMDAAFLTAAGLLTWAMVRRADPRNSDRASTRRGRAALLQSRLRQRQQKSKLSLTEYELEVASDLVAPSGAGCSFDQVGGLEEQARQLRSALLLPLQQPRLFAASKLLRPPKGILLHGPPGTGKTMLARAIAQEADFAFLCLNPARLFSKWYGESNKLAEAYFTLAHKLAPSILFIDEIDCIFSHGGKRGASEHEATAALRAQFLALWDGMLSPATRAAAQAHVVVIAATNQPSLVDPAVLRRLPLSLPVAMPDERARAEVLRRLLDGEAMARELDVAAIAARTHGYSGSDLEQLCRTAALRPLEEMMRREDGRKEGSEGTEGEGGTDGRESSSGSGGQSGTAAGGEPPAPPQMWARAGSLQAGGEGEGESEGEWCGLRQLAASDFDAAMAVVPPSGDRFAPRPSSFGDNDLSSDLYD